MTPPIGSSRRDSSRLFPAENQRRRRTPPEPNESKPSGSNGSWPWWVTAHLLVLSLAIFSWAWCLDLFAQPERPENYGFLKDLGRLPDLKAYGPYDVPAGETCPPSRFHQRHASLKPETLSALNGRLLRDFLRNYHKAEKPLYLTGDYLILGVRPLSDDDVFAPGLVVSLQAQTQAEEGSIQSNYPVRLAWLIPSADAKTAQFPLGSLIRFEKTPDSVAPLQVSQKHDAELPIVDACVISLAYGEKSAPDESKYHTAPPEKLKLAYNWPTPTPQAILVEPAIPQQ